jgi:type VI protein secretion system component Hcp
MSDERQKHDESQPAPDISEDLQPTGKIAAEITGGDITITKPVDISSPALLKDVLKSS